MTSVPQTPQLDYESVDTSRFELIDGCLVERPMPKFRHSEIQGNLMRLLAVKLANSGFREFPELSLDKVDLTTSDWMTPDVTVVEMAPVKRSERDNLLPPVPLVIEILSPDQTIPEMIRKADRYIDWGVQRVWLIEPQKQFAVSIERGSQPALVWPGFDLPIVEGLSLPLAELFD